MSRVTRSSSRINAPRENANPTSVATPTAPAAEGSRSELQILHFKESTAFETWLQTHHRSQSSGIWVKISKKASGISSVSYDEAVNAAHCYGWIDGQRKRHDEQHFLQRFTPRRKGSLWSKRNVDRVDALVRSGRMRPAGQAEVDAAKEDGRWEQAYAGSKDIEVTPEFQAALDGNGEAKRFFETLGRTQRYSFLHRIATARKPETRERKIRQFVELLARERIV